MESTQGLGSDDVSISKPVVPSSEHSNDVTAESKDNVNDTEKDESGKDNDGASVFSDADAGKAGNKQGMRYSIRVTLRVFNFSMQGEIRGEQGEQEELRVERDHDGWIN